jgi:hypothetical protein
VQEEEGQAAVFLEDVRRLWAWAREEDARAAAQGDEAPHLGDEIRCALIEASLHSLTANLPMELPALLVQHSLWTPRQALTYIRQNPDEWQRAEAFEKLLPFLPPELLPEALAAAREIKDEYHRARALTALAERLPPKLPPEALAAREIKDEWRRALALTALAAPLPPKLPPEALAAREIDEYHHVDILTALAPRLAELPRPTLYRSWDGTLPLLDRRTRRDLLADLQALVPVIHALGGEAAIAETARAIQDIARWWP